MRVGLRRRARLAAGFACALSGLVLGCGFDVRSPDLFFLTRTRSRTRLTLLVSDSGGVRCNGSAARRLPDSLLLQARDLAANLDNDAKRRLRIPAPKASVSFYTVKLSDGTIYFPDTAGASHRELAQLELFATQVADEVCRG